MERFAKSLKQKIGTIYSAKHLEEVAKRTGFMQRKSKLTPIMFYDMVLFKELDSGTMSLTDHCVALKQHYGVDIKKQSLDERFDSCSVAFVQELLKEQFTNQLSTAIKKENLTDELGHFSSIKPKDTTRYQIPSHLKEYYPGNTGSATGAGIHIQFEYDILNGRVNDLTVTDALRQDTTDAKQTIGDIEKGDLILRDLGYFSSDVLEQIDEREAYYISRPATGITLRYAKNQEKINFTSLYRRMKTKGLDSLEIAVLMGQKKLPVRLIVEVLPEQQVQKRLARAKKEAQKEGRNLTDEYKSRARLNLFVTNIPAQKVSTEKIRKIYRLRWQIELRFKAWKSFYHLAATKKMQRCRFECYLYSTLLLLLINWEIALNFFSILWNHTLKPLSLLKFHKTTSQHISVLRAAVLEAGDSLMNYIFFLYQVSYEHLMTEKRKHHKGLEEILAPTIQ